MTMKEADNICDTRPWLSVHPDASSSAATSLRVPPTHHFSPLAEEESTSLKKADNIRDKPSSSAHPDASSSPVASLRASPSHRFSALSEEESTSLKEADNIRDKPSLSAHPDTSSSPVASLQASPSHRFSAPSEEESTSLNTVSVDSPPLPPKSSKLSPSIPRRTSVPTAARHTTEVGIDRAPALLPRQPISHQTKRNTRVLPLPPGIMNSMTMSSDSSETNGLALLRDTQAVPVACQLDAGGTADRISPEAVEKPASVLPEGSNLGDDESVEVSTQRRSVSKMKRDIDARISAADILPETDSKPSIPARKVVIPSAFQ